MQQPSIVPSHGAPDPYAWLKPEDRPSAPPAPTAAVPRDSVGAPDAAAAPSTLAAALDRLKIGG